MSKTGIRTPSAPRAIGPYSQAIGVDRFVFCSGQIALSPADGTLVTGDIDRETRQVMDNLTAVLSAAGATWSDVVKTTIYLTDLGDFEPVNAAYAEYVGEPAPARATVQVAALPKGATVEIDAIAYVVGT
jgi:2-iminobutanoate/2-iminopropanoate deaminase